MLEWWLLSPLVKLVEAARSWWQGRTKRGYLQHKRAVLRYFFQHHKASLVATSSTTSSYGTRRATTNALDRSPCSPYPM